MLQMLEAENILESRTDQSNELTKEETTQVSISSNNQIKILSTTFDDINNQNNNQQLSYSESALMIETDREEFENFENDVEDDRDPDFIYSSSESSDEENDSPNVNATKEGRPRKGRKRKYPEQTDKSRKILKNSNSPHTSKRGTAIEKKEFLDYRCNCLDRCYEKVNQEGRKAIFEKFWQAGSYTLQNSIICSSVKENPIKRRRANGNLKRNFTRTYYLESFPVCRDLFVRTLHISTKRVNTALKKSRTLELQDSRGKHQKHFKISDIQRQEVVNHIKKIPKYKSHYRREQTDREYLPIDMTIECMYNLYKLEVNNPVSLSTYKKIFYSDFNITRKKLKKDTCNKCDTLSALSSSGNIDQYKKAEFECHLKAAKAARDMMNNDFKLAKEKAYIQTLSFDLEKTLPLPRIPTNIMFYKRQLWLYNLGIHSGKQDKSYCFLWTEGTAGRGAQEVGSCIKKFCETYLEENITDLYLWSDSCGGQNRNIKLCLLLKYILNKSSSLQSIYMKFLVSGHSFLPNDSDFGDIERALKYQQRLYTPQDYINVIKTSRKKSPFTIHTMNNDDFISSEILEKNIVNRKKDIIGEKINWLNVREIKINKNSPYSIFFKFAYDEDAYVEVDIKPKQKGKQSEVFSLNLPVLYPNGKPVSTPKLNDIKSIMHLIPEADQGFYTSLISSEEVVDDIDGYNGDLDFECQED
ncbi:uncharacterized protein LOC115889720 [Sitophilus oryzae]|uniref:Uncharacterized protein LOC115889720 n=1 Tax=Sitophilus oryzae TaxID=7048 RepID=A0A6J2YQN3_SITOR|nr:uncharacterized protein LOC115889720 [Sitophilus oryzae]